MTAKSHITLTSQGTTDPIPVRAMRLDRGLFHPVGQASVMLPAGVAAPDPNTSVSIALVQGDQTLPLMGGVVAQSVAAVRGAHLTIQEPAARLMQPMIDKSYANTMAGQIIQDLCNEIEVPTGMILPGLTVPHIVLRSNRTMLDHAMRLAKLSGLRLISDTSGKLGTVAIAVPIPGAPVDLNRAALILNDVANANAAPALRVIGAGALGTSGPGATTLPLADPGLISAGSGSAPATSNMAALRTLADVTTAQLAAAQRRSGGQSGVIVTTPLAEDLSPGDVIPLPDENGLPLRISRLEALNITLSAAQGLLAEYRFSDVEVA